MSAPKPREAIRAWLEGIADPEIEWEVEPTVAISTQVYHGVDGVMDFFNKILDAFEQVHQVPERFIDCGDQVLVFLRTEGRARTPGLEINGEWAHLITVRDGKIARLRMFRNRDAALEAAGLSE